MLKLAVDSLNNSSLTSTIPDCFRSRSLYSTPALICTVDTDKPEPPCCPKQEYELNMKSEIAVCLIRDKESERLAFNKNVELAAHTSVCMIPTENDAVVYSKVRDPRASSR